MLSLSSCYVKTFQLKPGPLLPIHMQAWAGILVVLTLNFSCFWCFHQALRLAPAIKCAHPFCSVGICLWKELSWTQIEELELNGIKLFSRDFTATGVCSAFIKYHSSYLLIRFPLCGEICINLRQHLRNQKCLNLYYNTNDDLGPWQCPLVHSGHDNCLQLCFFNRGKNSSVSLTEEY